MIIGQNPKFWKGQKREERMKEAARMKIDPRFYVKGSGRKETGELESQGNWK
jgi:hypothetical protein